MTPEPAGAFATRVRVFISAKSGDYEYAAQVYRRLTDAGVPAFFSRESLPELGIADYRREIDRAASCSRRTEIGLPLPAETALSSNGA